jgi:signal transduction histidine kinase/CheY-like chemotaxis protein/HAMP domain-containing protein
MPTKAPPGKVSPGGTARPPGLRAAGPFSSLRARLLALVALALAPAFMLVAWLHYDILRNERTVIADSARHIAASRAAEFGEKVAETKRLLAILASLPVARGDPRLPICSEVLARMHPDLHQYGNLGVASLDDRVACSAQPFDPAHPPRVGDRLWYRRVLDTQGFAVGEHLVGRVTGRHSLTFGSPVTNSQGEISGVVFAAFDLAWLSGFVSGLSMPANGALHLLDREGRILARHPDHGNWVGKMHPRAQMLLAISAGKTEGAAEAVGVDGVPRIYSYAHVPGTDNELTVFFGMPKEAAEAEARQRFGTSLAVMGLILLAGFALAWLAAEALVLSRVRRLSDTAGRLAGGDLGARSGIDAPDEIGRLAAAFDGMAGAVEERERQLDRANRALRIINASNRELLLSADEATLLGAICRHMVREGGYRAAWIGRRIDDESRSIEYVTGEGIDAEFEVALRQLTWADTPAGRGPLGTAIREQRAVIMQDILADALYAPWQALAAPRGFASAAALPIRLNGELWGAVALYAGKSGVFSEGEVALLAQAADDLSIGLAALQAQARERAAREASRIKSDFLASMSHELRTPLNAIIGFSEVLRDGMAGEVTPQQREYLQEILASGTHLLELINDILDLSKVEAGKMTLELECLPVDSLLRAGLAVVREKAMARRLTLELQAAPDVGELCADGRKVKQIVYNLLSNAVKFTPEGGRVALSARRVPLAEVPSGTEQPPGVLDYLEIAVADNGIGIATEDQARLFTAFTQIDSALSRRHEGTGLGLSLVKSLAQLHGGAVAMDSTPGKGSTFRVWLPYRPAADCLAVARRHSGQAAETRGGKVLVVEDDARAFELLRLALEQEGFTATRATNATEARARLEAETPDLVTLDILLPGEDGWQFLNWLKLSAAYAHIPVVVISIVAEQEKGFSLGASAVLQKPFHREDLMRALAELGFGPAGDAGQRILVVDDDPAAVEHLATLLAAEGYAVDRAHGGREGVAMALAAPPDLILLDLMMPDLSGFDVVTVLRTDSRTALAPIVIVTGKDLTLEDRTALNGHVQAVVQKSRFSPETFLAEVRRALGSRDR